MNRNRFSAADTMLGYLYQLRLALKLALEHVGDPSVDGISIETADDITFEESGSAVELVQSKHVARAAILRDSSPDLWKTIRIWLEEYSSSRIILGETLLTLITTGSTEAEEAVSFLKLEGRDTNKACDKLIAAAQATRNQDNINGASAFLALSQENKLLFLGKIYVLDHSPNIEDMLSSIKHELRLNVNPTHISLLVERLEGWWFGLSIRHLTGADHGVIALRELHERILSLTEQFERDNLPIDFLDTEPDQLDVDNDTRIFVRQLREISHTNRQLEFAIRDYYRAYAQRSRWIREDLLGVGELGKYERRLVEEWERHFARMQQKLGRPTTSDEQVAAGQDLFAYFEQQAQISIRRECTEPYVMRGSYHMLADQLQVGWHPEFLQRLQYLLAEAVL